MATRQLFARIDGGKFVDVEKAKVSIVSHGYNYGFVIFEGERTYLTPEGKTVFLARDQHSHRFFASAKEYEIDLPFSESQLNLWKMQTVQRNGGGRLYVRPQLHLENPFNDYGVDPGPDERAVLDIFVKEPHDYFGQQTKGIKVMKSDVMKPPSRSMSAQAKISGNYTTSTKAKRKARKHGFNDALLLNDRGKVAELTGANIVVQLDKYTFATPDRGSDRLFSITNDIAKVIANRNNYEYKETELTYKDVQKAISAAALGTAVGIEPISQLGDKLIGNGLPTLELKTMIRDFGLATTGQIPELAPTLTEVPIPELQAVRRPHSRGPVIIAV